LRATDIAFRYFPKWHIVREALTTPEDRNPQLTLALLAGLHSCVIKIIINATNKEQHRSYQNRYQKTKDPYFSWVRRQQTGMPFRDIAALLVMGYCLEHDKCGISHPFLRPLAPALLLVMRKDAGPINRDQLEQDFSAWFHAMRMRIRRTGSPGTGEDSLEERARSAIKQVNIFLHEARNHAPDLREFAKFRQQREHIRAKKPVKCTAFRTE
jgi:hypothetical protein